jgi:AraC family transcriptional regulator
MKYTFKKNIELNISGYTIETSLKDGENYKAIPKFWDDLKADGRFNRLYPLADELGVIGVCYGYNPETQSFKYVIGVNHKDLVDDEMETISFPSMDYAAFEAIGHLPKSIQELVPKLNDYMKDSQLTYGDGPELEVYPQGDMDSDDYRCYYWVPIQS